MKFRLITLLFITLLAGCKKEPLPELPEDNEPYYTIRGLINGDSINWTVGEDDATLTHGVSDMNGIQSFYGQINSPEDGMAIRIEVLRPEFVFNGKEISAINQSELPYLVHRKGAIKFNFGINYTQFNYMLVKNEWNDYQVMNQVPFSAYGLYDVDIKFTDFGPESFSVPVKYGFEEAGINAGFTSSGDSSILTLSALNTNGAHAWYIDGKLVSEQASFSQEMEDGIHTVRHKISDAFQNSVEHTTLIRFRDGHYYWQLKYYYVPPMQPSSHYGNVIVSVMKNGSWYTSANAQANIDNTFRVSDVETVLSSDLKPLWTIFDFTFRSTLYNENQSDSLYLPEMVGTVNVALQ